MLYNQEERQFMIWSETKEHETLYGARLMLNFHCRKVNRDIIKMVSPYLNYLIAISVVLGAILLAGIGYEAYKLIVNDKFNIWLMLISMIVSALSIYIIRKTFH